MVVNAYNGNSKVKTAEMIIVKISPELIKRSPLLFGEENIIKALILQHRVTSSEEGAGGFNVSGGNADHKKVILVLYKIPPICLRYRPSNLDQQNL